MKITTSILTAVLLCTSTAVYAQNSDSSNGSEAIEAPKEVQDVVVEIYRVAPGKHKAFLEAIASYDESTAAQACLRVSFISTIQGPHGISC